MKVLKWIKDVFIKKPQVEMEILSGIDLDQMYSSPEVEENIRAKIQECRTKTELIKPKYEESVSNLSLVQKVDDLPKEEIHELEKVSIILSETVLEKNTFQSLLQDQGNDGDYLEKYKDQIDQAIIQMEDHESRLSIIKNDLYHLEGERAEILYQISREKAALSFIKKLLFITIVCASIGTFILTTMFFVYNFDVFLPSLVAAMFIFALGLWIFYFRRHIIHELGKNQKLQKREIEITNKTKVKFVNVKQFLDYEYKKFQVNSSEMLKIRWENYQKHRRNEEKIDRMTNNISSLILELEQILMRNNINDSDFIIEHIDYFASKKERKMLGNKLNQDKESMKESFDQCEKEIRILSKLLEDIINRKQI